MAKPINGESQEPAFLSTLRGIGGMIGILQAHANMNKDGAVSARTVDSCAGKLHQLYLELWAILVDDNPHVQG